MMAAQWLAQDAAARRSKSAISVKGDILNELMNRDALNLLSFLDF